MFSIYSDERRYSLPIALGLSDDKTIDFILADIPFFSVGLLAFGVFTFLVVLRKTTTVSIWILSSALVAFIASILDLSQILTRGLFNVDQGVGLDQVSAIVVAREIGFSVSVGLRFLFFWAFVAERPRGEAPPPDVPNDRKSMFLSFPQDGLHSGSWYRWGLIGFLLKWSLLGVILAIPILQMIWRITYGVSMDGPVYMVETTLEIVASSLFVLKLILNTYLCNGNASPVSRTLRYYFVPFLALSTSVGISIGNCLLFAFSETTLGRFLQAIEIYALILFLLIYAFLPLSTPISLPIGPVTVKNRRESFTGLAARSFAGASLRPELRVNYVPQETRVVRPNDLRRPSTSSVLSSWMNFPRRNANRNSAGDQTVLWNRADPERGNSFDQTPVTTGPRVDEAKVGQAYRDSAYESIFNEPQVPVTGASEWYNQNSSESLEKVLQQATDTIVIGDTIADYPVPPPRMVSTRPSTAFSVGSYYTSDLGAPIPATEPVPTTYSQPLQLPQERSPIIRNSESPIYGLNGIIPAGERKRSSRLATEVRPRSSLASFEELLRQQTELDKSIAALRLFSPRGSTMPLQTEESVRMSTTSRRRSLDDDFVSIRPPNLTHRSTSSSSKPESASRSEFSLSIFPDPPEAVENPVLSPTALMALKAKARSVSLIRKNSGLGVPGALRNNMQSVPESPRKSGETDSGAARFNKFDSAGTQYDVTSFIGNFTTPAQKIPESRLSIVTSADEDATQAPQVASSLRTPTARQRKQVQSTYYGNSQVLNIGPASASSGLLTMYNNVAPTEPLPSTSAVKGPTEPRPAVIAPQAQGRTIGRKTSKPNMITSPLSSGGITVGMEPLAGNLNARWAERKGAGLGSGLPSRTRPTISNPRAPLEINRVSQLTEGAFERPRPAPLLQSNTTVSPTSGAKPTVTGARF